MSDGTTETQIENGFCHFRPFCPEVEIPPFPVMNLPPTLSDIVAGNADSCEVDDSMIALPVLAAVSACVHNKFSVRASWTEKNLALWLACVASPGERKSAAFDCAVKPISEYVASENEQRKPLIAEYRDNLEIIQKQISAAKEAAVKGKDADAAIDRLRSLRAKEAEMMDRPEKMLQVFCGDITPEALADVMTNNGGAIAMLSDEGGLLDTATGRQYSKTMSPDTMLKAFSGSPIQITRKTTGAVDIAHPSLAVGVMVQPVTIEAMAKDPILRGRGFVQRFLYDFPKSKAGHRKLANYDPPQNVKDAYRNLIFSLLRLEGDSDNPRIIQCSEEAFQYLDKWYREFDKRITEDLYSIAEWAAKLHGTILRIAALFHVCKYLNDADEIEIALDTIKDAVVVGEHFISGALKALGGGEDIDPMVTYLWGKLRSEDRISKRDLRRISRRFKKPEDLDATLDTLKEHGYIREEREKTGGRDSIFIVVNPEAKTKQ